jgi:hypothetical protein
MKRWFVLLGTILIISACSALAGDSNSNTSQTADQPTTDDESALVQWDRDPLHIVFQADVTGGEQFDTFVEGNRVPLCTIYGDGRIVWLSDDENQVLFDLLSDQQITDFVTDLTVIERFFTFKSGIDTLIPSAEVPITDTLLLQVNGVSHRTDNFGDWTENYFNRVLEKCTSLGTQPRIFQPSEGWFSVSIISYDSTLASVPWDAEATGLNLFDVAESPASSIWLENNLVLAIWTAIRDNGLRVQFNQDGSDFLVVLRVPGVTVDAPPPGIDENSTLATEEPEADS